MIRLTLNFCCFKRIEYNLENGFDKDLNLRLLKEAYLQGFLKKNLCYH